MGSETEETPKYFERKYLAAAPLYAWSSSVIHNYLAGRSALQLSQRFENNLRDRIEAHQALAVPDGVMLEDFLDFFINDVTAALLDAMCGKGLLKRNPTFTSAFRTFCDNLPTFMKRVPRFLAPQAYNARDEALLAVADWQRGQVRTSMRTQLLLIRMEMTHYGALNSSEKGSRPLFMKWGLTLGT